MPSRTRRIIAGTGLAAGLLVGSIAPAAAIPGEPEDSHCDRIERIEARAEARKERIDDKIARTEKIIVRFEEQAQRAEDRPARPERVERWERRIERMEAKVARLMGRIERIDARYDAIVAHCDDLALDGQPGDETTEGTSGEGTGEPDPVAAL